MSFHRAFACRVGSITQRLLAAWKSGWGNYQWEVMPWICLTCVRRPAFTCVSPRGQFLFPWARKRLRTGFLGQVWPWTSSRSAGSGGGQKTTGVLLLWSTCKGALTSCLRYVLLFCLWYSVYPSSKNLQKDSGQMREPRIAHRRARMLVAARLSSCWLSGKHGREVLAFGVTGAGELWKYWREVCS